MLQELKQGPKHLKVILMERMILKEDFEEQGESWQLISLEERVLRETKGQARHVQMERHKKSQPY